ncbi:hypothetical protein AB0H43_21270 [Hamadaea sp. NPDC050747]|uniref:hypothetical protein n=1 Tax=Hamadaea sp. NPDC050747 TaxID=3155789 RepID=UPI0033F41096
MEIPLGVQAAVAVVGLSAYLVLSIVYRRRWDKALRVALGRRLGLDVQWRRVADSGDIPIDAWYAETDGPLGKQLGQHLAIRFADIAALVVIGVLPPLALLGLEFLGHFHGAVIGLTAFAVIPVFGVYWSRRRAA